MISTIRKTRTESQNLANKMESSTKDGTTEGLPKRDLNEKVISEVFCPLQKPPSTVT